MSLSTPLSPSYGDSPATVWASARGIFGKRAQQLTVIIGDEDTIRAACASAGS